MLNVAEYRHENAVNYAIQWARGRNPAYFNFDRLGGDCTNFVSQCIYAGCGVMNQTPVYGWFYRSTNDRTASWTGVEYLYRFLVNNNGSGPYAKEVPLQQVQPGDIIQLANHSRFYHSLFVTRVDGMPTEDTVYVSTHTFDTLNRILSSYSYHTKRVLHIQGYRYYV